MRKLSGPSDLPASPGPPALGDYHCALCFYELDSFFFFFDSSYQGDHTVFAFLCLANFTLASCPLGSSIWSQIADCPFQKAG